VIGSRPFRPVAIAAVLGGLLACAAPDPGLPPVLRVAYPAMADFDDLPSLMAHARLEAKGYRIETTHYRVSELAAEALSRGDAEFANGAVRSYWAAAAKGAPVTTIMDHAANVHRLVVEAGIRDCAALEGRPFALHSEGAVGTALARAYFSEACPDVRPRLLMIPNSDNRAAALLAGAVSGSVLKVAEVIHLEQRAPGRFRVMSDFSARWPHVKTTGVYVNSRFASAHPEAVRDYIRARLQANRDILGDSDRVAAAAAGRLGASTLWPMIARAHTDLGIWHPDGGLTRDDVDETLRFFIAHGSLKAGLTTDHVADLSYLGAALQELGHHPATTGYGGR
jgi:ABC-type nitrate/sulfonate/bicarbonate transport system substrate-binding protein